MTSGGQVPKRIVFQVADVHEAVLSITRVADAGYGQLRRCLLDTIAGERVPILRKGNLYVMKAWVQEDRGPTSPFGRQGR